MSFFKNTSLHSTKIYYFDYNHVGYINYFDFFCHFLASSNHLVLNYIINFQIDYLVCYIHVVVSTLAELVFLLATHGLEQFPLKDIFQTLLC